MKKILFLIIFISISGCVMLGTNWIHSPASKEGMPLKYWHIHGGATKNSPPDSWIFSIEDSTQVIISARTISERKRFGGIILPILPLFLLPKNIYLGLTQKLSVRVQNDLHLPKSLLISRDLLALVSCSGSKRRDFGSPS